ncbi:MAG: hypothetical protein NTX28_15845 [Novosphingobium sp.]|nr:hypothetical protein [Novosphingobium sp.]
MSGGAKIAALGQSAQSAGLGSSQFGAITSACPLMRAKLAKKGLINDKTPKPLEYCDLKQLVVTLTPSEGKPVTVTIDRDRTKEPVNAAAVDDDYINELSSFDIVMEAVADIEDLHAIQFGAGAGSAGHAKPLQIKAQATNSVSHSSQTPRHPSCAVQGSALPMETHGGAPSETSLLIPRSGGSWGQWAQVWPFSTGAEKHYIVADSCGSLPIPQRANRAFVAQVVVYPAQEIALTIKGEKRFGVSQSKSQNFAKAEGAKGSGVWGATTQTQKIERGGKASSFTSVVDQNKTDYKSYKISIDGDNNSNETITETTFKGDYSESRTLTSKEDIRVLKAPIGSHVVSSTSGDSTTGKIPDQVEKHKYNFSDRFSLKIKSGGQEAEIRPSEIVDTFFSIVEAIEDFRKIFSGVQLGYKVDASFTFMEGTLTVAAGRRWPKTLAYVEDQRVWYIERYLNVGGNITLAKGTIAASIGVEFDKGYLPVGGKIMATVSYSLGLSLKPKVELCYTNAKRKTKADLTTNVPVAVESTFKFECVAMYRAFGESFCGILSLKGDIILQGDLQFSVRTDPKLMVSAKSTGLVLTGYWEKTGATPARKEFEPVVLAEPAVIWEPHDLFAREPAAK